MQNLRDIDHRIIAWTEKSSPLSATAWDLEDDSLVCAFGPTKSNPLLSLRRLRRETYRPEDSILIASWDAVPPNPELLCDSILDIHVFSEDQTIVVILAGGDIVVVRQDAQSGDSAVEIVGSVDSGIEAAAWSPDEELVMLVTKDDKILIMTRAFESTAEIVLSAKDLEVSNHVSVGWGKAETQFKGRGAKALRDPTIPEHIDAGILSSTDTGEASISWRGDGQYVAVNRVLDTRRVIRVYTREGALDSVSEAVDGLEGALSWKPSGQVIAGIQRRQDCIDVIFFERNGLRHGEFSLRLSEQDILANTSIKLRWNVDSSVLAVLLHNRIQLWASSNYRWYLKQDVELSNNDATPVMAWHTEKPLYLGVGAGKEVHIMSYVLQYTTGSTAPPNDLGLIAVIDGCKLDITPLRLANVPPPMAHDQYEFSRPIIDVAFSMDGKSIAALHSNMVTVITCDYRHKILAKHASNFLMEENSVLSQQLEFTRDECIIVLLAKQNDDKSCLWIKEATQDDAQLHTLQSRITNLTCSTGERRLSFTRAGTIIDISTSEQSGNLPAGCTTTQIWEHDNDAIHFGLTATGVLHVRGSTHQSKVTGCTSFLIAGSFLILTTSQHLLKFVHLHHGVLEIPGDEPEADERCRSVERGAKIVTVMPSAYSLVLQMPRGNLETIFPRALVLAGIRQRIAERDYKKAFEICRSHRVDMNILYDYRPSQLLEDIDLFIKQVRRSEYIDLFLSSLSDEDSTKTIYRETLHSTQEVLPATSPSGKVNLVCDAFLSSLQKRMPKSLQNVITAHVCKSPPDLEAALRLVAALRKTGTEEELEHAVDHVCFLADVNRLYDTALGMYELEVTLLIAQQSQKDPREYLPYLQSLQGMEAERQHFTIDNDLKRYSKALTHLHNLSVFEELTTYMGRHELYSTAIELYRHDKQRLVQLMRLYADFLVSRNRYSDAAVLYEYVQDFQAAHEAYRSANMWKECLSTATMASLSAAETQEVAMSIAEAQEESKDYVSAATIYLDYLQDLSAAIRLQCKAYEFAEAIRLAMLKQSSHLLTEVIDPGLVEGSASMTELLAEMKGQINAQVPRLRELRQKKFEEPMAYLAAGEGEDGDIPDNLSVAPTDASTSGGTFMTRYTNRSTGTLATNATRKTSKNRRREERKRAQGKKGTIYEEEYLVNSITRLIERLNTTGEDVGKLVQGLIRRAMRERAVAVENAMIEVWDLCQLHMKEVYEVQVQHIPVDVKDEEPGMRRPWGGQGVLWDSLNASQSKIVAPELKVFQRAGALTS